MSRRLVNRRIRLLLAFLVLAFAGTLARAVWLQGVQAASLSRMAASQHRETVIVPAGRGTIYDRTGVQLAIGEQDDDGLRRPAPGQGSARRRAGRRARARRRARDAVPRAGRPLSRLRLRRAEGRPGQGLGAREARGSAGSASIPRRSGTYPQGTVAAQVLGYAGVDNHGLAGLELQLDKTLSGSPGTETIVKDPFGRAIDVVSQTPEREGRDVFVTIDHTIQANAEPILRQTVTSGVRRARPRSCSTRTPATCSRWRCSPATTRTTSRRPRPDWQEQPRRDGRVRARLDVQARHRRGRALGPARVTEHRLHPAVLDPRRRPHRPRRGEARDRDADGGADPLALVERRRDHARREARPAAARVVDHALRLRQPDRDRLPGREPRDRAAARPVVGLDDRQRADRPGHRRDADPDGVRLRGDREPAASGCSRTSSTTSPARPRRR